ncbi:hypothetical protein C0J52_08922 [Blattella germanica]|nr:hypothetical protein C0J52_08922 [Blattella germanica]
MRMLYLTFIDMASPRTRRVLRDLKDMKPNDGNTNKVGGNRKAKEFFETQDDWDDSMSIQQRYNTKAAALYRDKKYSSSTINRYSNNSSIGGGSTGSYGNSGDSYQSNPDSGGYQSGGGYQSLDGQQQFKDQKEAFFARKQNENALKPDDIPPNQGGRYSGFGYTMEPPPRSTSQEFFDSAVSSLASIGGLASQKVADISVTVGEKVKEGKLLEDVSTQVSNIATKVGDLGRRGWKDLQGTNTAPSPTKGEVGETNDGVSTEKSSLLLEGGGVAQRNQSKDNIGSPLLTENRGNSAYVEEWLNWNSEEKSHSKSASSPKSPKSPKSPTEWSGWESGKPSDGSVQNVGAGNGSSRKSKKKSPSAKEGLLIDLAEEKGNNDWNSKWDDEAWEMLNKKD